VNREAATRELLYFIDRFIPGSDNKAIYEKRLNQWSDEEFDDYMNNLASGKETLALFAANNSPHKLDILNLYSVADELNYKLFQHLDLTDPITGQVVRTNVPHLVLRLPLRRQVQMLYKKMSIPEDDDTVDERTGQATGESKGARVSYPELQVNAAKGLNKSIIEMLKFRGGDEKAYNAMNRAIMETGGVSMDTISSMLPSKVKATQTLSVMFKSAHLNTNL